tara:strand:- start:300 stop:449 length:150 start_codon:yes stop_codon:yes gene_type:complete
MKYALIVLAIIALIFLFAAIMIEAAFKKYERNKFNQNLNKYNNERKRNT